MKNITIEKSKTLQVQQYSPITYKISAEVDTENKIDDALDLISKLIDDNFRKDLNKLKHKTSVANQTTDSVKKQSESQVAHEKEGSLCKNDGVKDIVAPDGGDKDKPSLLVRCKDTVASLPKEKISEFRKAITIAAQALNADSISKISEKDYEKFWEILSENFDGL